MAKQTVRDVIGEPNGWSNCVSDEPVAGPAVSGAVILDVFSTVNEISIHWPAILVSRLFRFSRSAIRKFS